MEMQAYSKKIEIENHFMSNALCSVGAAEDPKQIHTQEGQLTRILVAPSELVNNIIVHAYLLLIFKHIVLSNRLCLIF